MATIPQINHIGLNPKTTYYISTTGRPLLFPGGNLWKTVTLSNITEGNRLNVDTAEQVAKALVFLKNSPFENIVIDDFNFLMQDFYMKNAMKGGWQTPKEIGSFMNEVFAAIRLYEEGSKNLIILAHAETENLPDGRISYKMKTVGKMVSEYITPEAKMDIVLIGKSYFDSAEKRVIREYITEEDGVIVGPKAGYNMLPATIPNDLGVVVQKIKEYYG